MNPTQRSPNTGRTFEVGAQYWWREGDDYVMPRGNSRYEQPAGFVAVVAKSETELEFDNGPLEAVPANIDPTDVNHVGAAVTYAGRHRSAVHDPQAARPMPVTMSNAMDDHQVRERSLLAAAQHAERNTSSAETPPDSTPPPAPRSRRRSKADA